VNVTRRVSRTTLEFFDGLSGMACFFNPLCISDFVFGRALGDASDFGFAGTVADGTFGLTAVFSSATFG